MVGSRGRNTALHWFCFPIPFLALPARVMKAGAAPPCDLVAERVGGPEVETATALDARERKDAVAVCRYRDLAGPAIDSYRRETAACIRDVRLHGPRSAEAERVVERVRANLRGTVATWRWLEPVLARVACPAP